MFDFAEEQSVEREEVSALLRPNDQSRRQFAALNRSREILSDRAEGDRRLFIDLLFKREKSIGEIRFLDADANVNHSSHPPEKK